MMRIATAFAFLLACAATPALADPPCSKLAWPLVHEQALMKAPAARVKNGDILGVLPDQALVLALKPTADANLPFPSAKPGDPQKFAGTLRIAVPPGDYFISLSSEGWIDVYQDGASVASTAHTGDPDCPGLRKSVRFPLTDRPVTLEVSNAPAAAITLAITPAH
jgi:hypothetical protein